MSFWLSWKNLLYVFWKGFLQGFDRDMRPKTERSSETSAISMPALDISEPLLIIRWSIVEQLTVYRPHSGICESAGL